MVGFQYCVPVWNATYLHNHIKLFSPSVFKIQKTSDLYLLIQVADENNFWVCNSQQN